MSPTSYQTAPPRNVQFASKGDAQGNIPRSYGATLSSHELRLEDGPFGTEQRSSSLSASTRATGEPPGLPLRRQPVLQLHGVLTSYQADQVTATGAHRTLGTRSSSHGAMNGRPSITHGKPNNRPPSNECVPPDSASSSSQRPSPCSARLRRFRSPSPGSTGSHRELERARVSRCPPTASLHRC